MRKLLAVLLVLVVSLAAAAACITTKYYIFDGEMYPQNAQVLDLRGEYISFAHYQKLENAFPDSLIMWDVPFQGKTEPSTSRELVMSAFRPEDVQMLAYFPDLEQLDARGCGNQLSWLSELMETRPEVNVRFAFTLDGTVYGQSAKQIVVGDITPEQYTLLPCMENLSGIIIREDIDEDALAWIVDFSRERNLEIKLSLGEKSISAADTDLTLSRMTEAQARLLPLMTGLQTIHLEEPEAPMAVISDLMAALPDTVVTWEKTILGVTYQSDATVIDLTDVISRAEGQNPEEKTAYQLASEQNVMGTREEIPSSVLVGNNYPLPDRTGETVELIQQLEAFVEYFPAVEKLVLCGAWLDNEAMSQFREDHRADYKVVWSVQCGALATRTDATFFMPTKYFVKTGSFADWNTYNLRYCEDIIAMDLGHSSIATVEFVRYMPNLTYLDIAITHLLDISPLAECKNLVFLVMHTQSMPLDYTPLYECSSLEDLNIACNPGDLSAVFKMTHLKNLWLTGCSEQTYRQAKAAMPDTNIGYNYKGTNTGWRNLPNYYKMRDAMLMFYMN